MLFLLTFSGLHLYHAAVMWKRTPGYVSAS